MSVTETITGVGVLDKGVAIIDLCERRPSLGADIARELAMTVPTAHRLANALAAHGLLQRDQDGRFHLGPRFLSSRATGLARPVLARLTSRIGESSQLWVARGEVRVCAASEISGTELRVELNVGTRLPLADGGSAARVLQGETSDTGWVESLSQRTPGLGSVSAPVLVGGGAVAAVCVVVPLARVSSTPGQMYGQDAVEASREIALSLEA